MNTSGRISVFGNRRSGLAGEGLRKVLNAWKSRQKKFSDGDEGEDAKRASELAAYEVALAQGNRECVALGRCG